MGTARRRALGTAGLVLVTVGVVAAGVAVRHPGQVVGTPVEVLAPPSAAADSTAPPRVTKQPHVFDEHARSTSRASSPWVVVNKKHPIRPPDFRPDLRLVRGYQVAAPAARPLGRMLAAADRLGFGFKIASAFRSFAYQQTVYGNVVAAQGQEAADLLSARPGFSEHQTGLAIDLITPAAPACDFTACFATTPAGRWLTRNAWRWGFVVRYPPGASRVTGYSPEPWHLRYVGRALAAELRRTRTRTLEQFFGISGGDYR